MNNSLEVQELVQEIKDMIAEAINPVEKSVETEESVVEKASCECATCKAEGISCDNCDDCMSKSYDSDNEDEDKWDNMEKACWSGYKQVGMKDKNGKKVPNCVPVEKARDVETKEEIKKSLWNGIFGGELK